MKTVTFWVIKNAKSFGLQIGDVLKAKKEPRNPVDKYVVAEMKMNNLVILLVILRERIRKIYESNFRYFENRLQFTSYSYQSNPCQSSTWIGHASPNTGKYGPEKTPYLDSFHAMKQDACELLITCYKLQL